MKQFILYISLLLLVGVYGCESYYEPDIEEFPDALIVEGMLTDQNDYATIKLTRSASFNDASYYSREKKATVTIESESGKSYTTSETEVGVYQTNERVPTTVGELYYVEIITSSGEKYRSNKEKMMPSTPIDSIYLTDSIFKEIRYDDWGDPVVQNYGGITFSVVPHDPGVDGAGFIYKWNALVNYYVECGTAPNITSYYCWKYMNSKQVYVYDYVKDGYVNELPLGDLHSLSFYQLSPLPIDSSRFDQPISSISSSSFYYKLSQYTTTKAGSKFWRSVKNQSEASGKLFDPVEEQIIGNIYCVSDSSKVAFGFFNTASFSEKIIGVQLGYNSHTDVKRVDIMPTALSDEDCFMGFRPDFWY
jgi:hypothetical protein